MIIFYLTTFFFKYIRHSSCFFLLSLPLKMNMNSALMTDSGLNSLGGLAEGMGKREKGNLA